ncbi:sigma 54-interacting transcriptional regulator [Polyangium sp. 15x6]|uniref:sigma 54-interacting transcriptional regulator n=1 Tax=Polyangium sp. 15x6 TaxID=3042687 RepID=UPI00249B9A84|nr:sigma 54-interacting transcriptional regulator [Polyangium sp. 15x6]
MILVSWVAFASDPYQRDRNGRYATGEGGKFLPGAALELLTSQHSPYRDRIKKAYFLVRSGPAEERTSREVDPRELDVYATLESALKEHVPRLGVHKLVWDTIEPPTAHRPLLKFTADSLRQIRRENPEAALLVNAGTGTAQMHTTMLAALGARCAGDNVEAVQIILRDRRRDPTKILENVPWDLLDQLNVDESRSEVDTGRPTWDLESARSPALKQMLAQIEEAALVPFPVLVHGSRGSGKTHVAERLRARYLAHRRRVGKGSWELRVNCAALQKELLLSELFGHKKGAFTGADRDKKGLLEQAEGDCVFLDEVHHLDRDAQAKLLVALERGGQFRPVGSDGPKYSNFRLVCATNRPLAEVRSSLLPDFWDRIADFQIQVPDLRACREDLEGMWLCALRDACRDVAKVKESATDRAESRAAALFGRFRDEQNQGVVTTLERQELPGNWRDLQRVARRLVARSLGTGTAPKVDSAMIAGLLAEEEPRGDETTPLQALHRSIGSLADWVRKGHGIDLDKLQEELERRLLVAAFDARGGGQGSAELVGLIKRTFNARLQKLKAANPRRGPG